SARLLHPGRAGHFYRFCSDGPGVGPKPLGWCTSLPHKLLLLTDPLWPCDPRWSDRLIVSLTFLPDLNGPVDSDERTRHAQLWWIQLDPARSAVIATGRLIPGEPALSPAEEELPSVSRTGDGKLTLAYLAYQKFDATHHLRLAPMERDDSGRFRVDAQAVVELPGNRVRARPAFSSDGRWVYSIPR